MRTEINEAVQIVDEQREALRSDAMKKFSPLLGRTFFEYAYDDGPPEEAQAREASFAAAVYGTIAHAARTEDPELGNKAVLAMLRANKIVAKRIAKHEANHAPAVIRRR